MAVLSSFEGFEKRLELRFSGDDPLGLRRLPIPTLTQVLSEVQCTIVSAVGNRFFDSYVLSESSLFIYPRKIIIKTCGTTQLLKSIPSLLPHASALGLRLLSCRYSRGSFIFPKSQPFPHSSFHEEVAYLERFLPAHLRCRKACILPSGNRHHWHVYSAVSDDMKMVETHGLYFTVEVCMTDLDQTLCTGFHRIESNINLSGDDAGRKMTDMTGIDGINPCSLVCGYAFDPCGYSMNGLDGDCYSTVHVTPEDGYSYASYECVGKGWITGTVDALKKAVMVFGPRSVSVSVCGGDDEEGIFSAVAKAMKMVGLKCDSEAAEVFLGVGVVTYQTFSIAMDVEMEKVTTFSCSHE